MRRKRSLARDVNAWAWTPRERGLFASSLVTTPATLAEAFDETVRVMATLTRVEAEPDEVETIKALIEAEAVYQRETVQGLARKLGYYESMAGGLEREASYYEAVSQVTARQLREVADRYFTFDRAVVTGLMPHETQLTEARVRETLTHLAAHRPATLPARTLAAPTPLRLVGNMRKERPGITVQKLDNGATVIVREERSVPLMAMRASFHGGVRYESPEESGLTTLLARTLTRGTETLGAEAFSHLVDSMAGSLSAIAGRNSMSLRGEFLSKHFERAFELFSDSLQRPAFSDEEFERERALQLQDIASRDDRPSSLAFELFAKTLWLAHPYRLSTLGEKGHGGTAHPGRAAPLPPAPHGPDPDDRGDRRRRGHRAGAGAGEGRLRWHARRRGRGAHGRPGAGVERPARSPPHACRRRRPTWCSASPARA